MRYNLASERRHEKYTQKELAGKLGIGERQYQALELGESDGSIKIWQKLSHLLNKPIDYLLQQTEEHSA